MKKIVKSEEYNLNEIFGKNKVDKWLKSYPILMNEDVKKWIVDKIDKYTDEGKLASGFNVPSYLKPLYQYCLYNKTNNPSDLLKEDIDQRNLRVKKYLKEFLMNGETTLDEVKELGFRKIPSEVSVRNSIQSRIKSFYSNRGSNVSYNLKSKKTGENKREITLTKDLIKKIQSNLESSNYRLICKCESQLGLRISDILDELTSGKYIVEKYKDRYFVRNFETQKRKVTINFMFFTKELQESFQANTGIDDLTKLELSDLFLSRNGKRISRNSYLARIKAIIKELGLKGNIKTHSFRKYYIGSIGKCANSLSDPRILSHFEGHESPYTDQSYLRLIKDIGSYYEEWVKTEKCVCIDCILIDKTNKEVLALKEENLKLKEQIDIVLKEKIEFEKDITQKIESIKEEIPSNNLESIKIFSEKIIGAIRDRNTPKTEFMQHSEEMSNEDHSIDLYTNVVVETLFDCARSELMNDPNFLKEFVSKIKPLI